MSWYADDRVYFILPYGHTQTRIDKWEDALKFAAQLPNHCEDVNRNISIDCYFERDLCYPAATRPFYRAYINHQALRKAQGYFTGY